MFVLIYSLYFFDPKTFNSRKQLLGVIPIHFWGCPKCHPISYGGRGVGKKVKKVKLNKASVTSNKGGGGSGVYTKKSVACLPLLHRLSFETIFFDTVTSDNIGRNTP